LTKLNNKELESMKESLYQIIIERQSMLDGEDEKKMDDSDREYINSINVGDKDPYTDCVETLDNFGVDYSGIEIQSWTSFFDPRRFFKFDTYNENECESFRDYLVKEYGVNKKILFLK